MKKNSENTNMALTLKPDWGSDTAEAVVSCQRFGMARSVISLIDWDDTWRPDSSATLVLILSLYLILLPVTSDVSDTFYPPIYS